MTKQALYMWLHGRKSPGLLYLSTQTFLYTMQLIFFDDPSIRSALKPFTLTRPIARIRIGIWQVDEKWQKRLSEHISIGNPAYLTETYLEQKFPFTHSQDNLLLNGAVCPDDELTAAVVRLTPKALLKAGNQVVAVRMTDKELIGLKERLNETSYANFNAILEEHLAGYATVSYQAAVVSIQNTWEIFQQNGSQIEADFSQVIRHRTSARITDPHTVVYHPDNVFVEEGASVKASVINAEDGPVYLGKNATVHENAVIIGPFAMLESSHVNIGSKIREATTIGPYCKVGGEVKNTVFFANSNKGHEGFLGNAVVGEWCNFGADTNASNLKNNYKPVQIWHYGTKSYQDTHTLFCGLMMGDHSKCGINTMFNTGTVVGVSANIFGSDYPPKFIPSFTWGGIQQQEVYNLPKAMEVAAAVMERRGLPLTEADRAILTHVFNNRQEEM